MRVRPSGRLLSVCNNLSWLLGDVWPSHPGHVMSRWLTWGLLAYTAVPHASTWEPECYRWVTQRFNSHCDLQYLVIKPKTTRYNGQSEQPVSTVGRRCCQKWCPVIRGIQTGFHRCLVIHHTWLITEPLFGGHYRTVLTSLTWRDSVLTAEATKAVIVSSDTRLTAIFNWSTGLLSLLIVSKIRVGDVLNQTNVWVHHQTLQERHVRLRENIAGDEGPLALAHWSMTSTGLKHPEN